MRRFASFLPALFLSLSLLSARTVNVTGTVKDERGKAADGVFVSDGFQCFKVSRNGRFSFVADSDRSRCIFVIPSSDYEVPADKNGKFDGYVYLTQSDDRQECSFTLSRHKTPCNVYSVIFEGDPQSMSSRPHSVASWDWVVSSMCEYGKTFEVPVYNIILGDMVTNEIEVDGMAEKFLKTFSGMGIKTMFVAGNHDHVQKAKTFADATSAYVKYFGPYNYALNIGKVHYIFLDSCAWGEGGKKKYAIGFNDEAMAFLESDLENVPQETPVVISTHCPVTQSLDGEYPHLGRKIIHYDEFIRLLKGRRVNMWYGHTHLNANNAYTRDELDKYAPGVLSLDSHLVGRVGGAWSCSGEITMDGAPRGVAVMDVNGTDISWHYHSLEKQYPEDFNVYTPGCFLEGGYDYGNTLFCNVYMWDEKWETPKWYENGVMIREMEKCIESKDAANDPLYIYLYNKWDKAGLVDNEVRPEPSKPTYCNHLFKIMPSEGVRNGEIRFRDRFGREMKRTVSW